MPEVAYGDKIIAKTLVHTHLTQQVQVLSVGDLVNKKRKLKVKPGMFVKVLVGNHPVIRAYGQECMILNDQSVMLLSDKECETKTEDQDAV